MWIITFFLGSMFSRTVVCFQIGFIPNITFIPYDSNSTTINVNGSCIACGCYAKQNNYSGFNCFANNSTCSMFPTYSTRYGLSTTENATLYFFDLPPTEGFDVQTTTSVAAVVHTTQPIIYRNLTSTSDVLVGIWNATIGGDSLVATQGPSNGQYPVAAEGPAGAHDYNVATKYNSYGHANVSMSLPGAGIGTGFYVTMAVGACVVTGIQFATANDAPERDPITMTLEGSNIVNASLLLQGSSWTLIYSGLTGISNTTAPSRTTYVAPQNFTNTARFTSYRFIMTSQRSISTNLQYSEAHLLGYV